MKNFGFYIIILLIISISCSDKKSDSANDEQKDELQEQIDKKVEEATGLTADEISEQADNIPSEKKYPIKSAIINFKRSGIIGENKVIVYFDDYGLKERNEVYDTEGKLEEIRFSDGINTYLINFKYDDAKIAYIQGSGRYGTEMKFVAEPFTRDQDIAKYKYIKLPNMLIAGKDCEAYSTEIKMGKTIFAGWNNIHLYTKAITDFGDAVTEAVSIEENAEVDKSLFKVPEGFTVQNMY